VGGGGDELAVRTAATYPRSEPNHAEVFSCCLTTDPCLREANFTLASISLACPAARFHCLERGSRPRLNRRFMVHTAAARQGKPEFQTTSGAQRAGNHEAPGFARTLCLVSAWRSSSSCVIGDALANLERSTMRIARAMPRLRPARGSCRGLKTPCVCAEEPRTAHGARGRVPLPNAVTIQVGRCLRWRQRSRRYWKVRDLIDTTRCASQTRGATSSRQGTALATLIGMTFASGREAEQLRLAMDGLARSRARTRRESFREASPGDSPSRHVVLAGVALRRRHRAGWTSCHGEPRGGPERQGTRGAPCEHRVWIVRPSMRGDTGSHSHPEGGGGPSGGREGRGWWRRA